MTAPVVPASLTVAYNGDYYANEIIITAGDDTHTGFRLYRDDGGGWALLDTIYSSDPTYTGYRGGESDTGKPWGVVAFNDDGDSPRLEINTGPPAAAIESLGAARTATPGEVALSWGWTGESKTVYLFAASEYDAGSNSFAAKGSADAQALSALIAGIPRFETWVFRLYETSSTWQQTPLAECTLASAVLSAMPAPSNIGASVSELNRILIDFDPINWEDAPEFLYRFTFQQGVEPPIVLERGWSVLGNGVRRQLYDEVIGITKANAAEWTCTIRGISTLGEGEATAPFSLVQETTAHLVSFDMDDTAQISWVFDDWQNAVPLEVETRIDGGPWRPTFVTDKTRSNDELYGDRCIIGNDWSGGVLGFVHFHWPFDGQHHAVEARARIQGSADEWLYGPVQSIPLRSLYVPELLWGTIQFQGDAGTIALPQPTFMVRRPDYYERYTIDVSVDGGPFAHFADLAGNAAYRIGIAWNDTVARLPESIQDGGNHALNFRLNAIQNGQIVFGYPLPEATVTVPTAAALVPKAPEWTFASREDAGALLVFVAANGPDPHGTTIRFDIDDAPATTAELPDVNPNRKTFRLTLPPADGLFRVIACTFTTFATMTGKSRIMVRTLGHQQKKPRQIPPPTVNAELQRQASGAVPDRVRLTWPAGQMVQLVAQLGATAFLLGYADSTESEAIIEDTRARLPKTGALYPVRFGVRTYRRDAEAGAIRSTDNIGIRAYPAPQASPDVSTDVDLLDSAVLYWITGRIALSFPSVPEPMRNLIVSSAVKAALRRIKATVATGGRATLDDFGAFAAKWSKNRFDARGSLIPAARGVEFVPSAGFVAGVKAGTVLTDAEATP